MIRSENIFLSFIVPVYNVKPFIQECIESILSQNNCSFELILIDDGSSDGSEHICDKYSEDDERIIVIHQRNKGVSAARNEGLKIARGKWIWFVDGDDYIAPNSINVLNDFLKEISTDCVFFNLSELRDNVLYTNSTSQSKENVFSMQKDEFLLTFSSFFNPTILFNNSIIHRYLLYFTDNLKVAEDLEFQYKYLLHCKTPTYLNEALYIYRRRSDSTTTNDTFYNNNLKDSFQASLNLLEYLKKWHIKPESWLSFRIRQLLKSGLQSAEKLKVLDKRTLRKNLSNILKDYSDYGIRDIADHTLNLASKSLSLYLALLKLFY